MDVTRQEPAVRWGWDPRAGRYRDLTTGRFLARDAVLEYVERSTGASIAVSDSLATMAAEQTITADVWARSLWTEIKQEHIRQYLLGIGGVNQMDASHWGRVGAILRDQRKYFDGFIEEVRAGTVSEGQIATRSRMYLNAAREAFERANALVQQNAEMDEESWVLGTAEHCPDCVAFSEEGWKPVGYFPMPGAGQTQCLSNCKCHKEYRRAPTDGENA